MDYESVTLDMIGRGGQEDDLPLVEQVNQAIQSVATTVCDGRFNDKGVVTIKIKIESMTEEGDAVLLVGEVNEKHPTRKTKALSALMDSAEGAVAVSHKQQAIPFSDDETVTPIMKGCTK